MKVVFSDAFLGMLTFCNMYQFNIYGNGYIFVRFESTKQKLVLGFSVGVSMIATEEEEGYKEGGKDDG